MESMKASEGAGDQEDRHHIRICMHTWVGTRLQLRCLLQFHLSGLHQRSLRQQRAPN